jgi:hypothetical protein
MPAAEQEDPPKVFVVALSVLLVLVVLTAFLVPPLVFERISRTERLTVECKAVPSATSATPPTPPLAPRASVFGFAVMCILTCAVLGLVFYIPKGPMEACQLLEGRVTQLEAQTSKLLTVLDFEDRLKQPETHVEQTGAACAWNRRFFHLDQES